MACKVTKYFLQSLRIKREFINLYKLEVLFDAICYLLPGGHCASFHWASFANRLTNSSSEMMGICSSWALRFLPDVDCISLLIR